MNIRIKKGVECQGFTIGQFRFAVDQYLNIPYRSFLTIHTVNGPANNLFKADQISEVPHT